MGCWEEAELALTCCLLLQLFSSFRPGNADGPTASANYPLHLFLHKKEAIYKKAQGFGILGKPLTTTGNTQEEAKRKQV